MSDLQINVMGERGDLQIVGRRGDPSRRCEFPQYCIAVVLVSRHLEV